MNKYILGIEGMKCDKCVLHVEEVIKENVKAKKVTASKEDNNLIVISEENLSQQDFEKMYESTGFKVVSYECKQAEKKLFGWR